MHGRVPLLEQVSSGGGAAASPWESVGTNQKQGGTTTCLINVHMTQGCRSVDLGTRFSISTMLFK